MNPKLKMFLEAKDLDELMLARRDLQEFSDDDCRDITEVLSDWSERQAVSNLLMHPSVIPADLRLEMLFKGLKDEEVPYYMLASSVGLQEIDPSTLADEERRYLVDRLFSIANAHSEVASRATLSVQTYLNESDAPRMFVLLEHPNETVRHNALAWLIRKVGSKGTEHFSVVAGSSEVPEETREMAIAKLEEFKAKKAKREFTNLGMTLLSHIPNLSDFSAS